MNKLNKIKFATTTLGCKVNLYETESIISTLIKEGWEYVTNDEMVDVYLINTCTVTATSDQKSRQMIRQARRKYPRAIIVAMGCYTQTNSSEALDLADIVIGTSCKNMIIAAVNRYQQDQSKLSLVKPSNEFTCYEELKLSSLNNHTRGFVKIQDGCENYCSYCLIPYARGPIKSRKAENIIAEIEQLVMMNTKEVIISGINTGTYGQDLGNINLAKLITMIMEQTNLYQLRLSSIELMEVTDELLDVMQKYHTRIANHLHIPLQGGSDATLIRMKRKYLTNDYRMLINKIRKIFPDMAITTDCLAGFVGETELDFQNTKAFIKEIGFAGMHIFPYSRRRGTAADQMEGHLDPNVIKERANELIKIANELKHNYQQKFIGQKMNVLFEQQKNGYWVGHTSNYLEVAVKSINNLNNEICLCQIDDLKNDILYATLIKEEK